MLTNLTTDADLRSAARSWIARNGRPSRQLVLAAITFSDAHGDPLRDNPFRRALLDVDLELGDAPAVAAAGPFRSVS